MRINFFMYLIKLAFGIKGRIVVLIIFYTQVIFLSILYSIPVYNSVAFWSYHFYDVGMTILNISSISIFLLINNI